MAKCGTISQYVKGCRCNLCGPEGRRYHAEWRSKNADKVRESQRRSRLKNPPNPEMTRERNARYKAANRSKLIVKDRERYAANRERMIEAQIERDRNNPKLAEYRRALYLRNRQVRVNAAIRREQSINESTRAVATRNGLPWTCAEDAIAARSDLFIAEAAFLLGRTYSAVRARRVLLRKEQTA